MQFSFEALWNVKPRHGILFCEIYNSVIEFQNSGKMLWLDLFVQLLNGTKWHQVCISAFSRRIFQFCSKRCISKLHEENVNKYTRPRVRNRFVCFDFDVHISPIMNHFMNQKVCWKACMKWTCLVCVWQSSAKICCATDCSNFMSFHNPPQVEVPEQRNLIGYNARRWNAMYNFPKKGQYF